MYKDKILGVHTVFIVKINGNDVAISMIYDEELQRVQVTAIHIDTDKISLMKKHQFLSLNHMNECKYLDSFSSNIGHLEIGDLTI